MSRTPYGLAAAIIDKKRGKRKMSCTPSGLALPAKGPKFYGKMKNVTHAIWSGCDCHQAKKRRKMKNVTHAIWSGRGCRQAKKKEKTKNFTHTVWSGRGRHQQKN